MYTKREFVGVSVLTAITLGLVFSVFFAALPVSAQLADDYGMISAGNYCPKLSITMQRGARDVSYSGQVTELQHFLSDYYDIDPEEIMTGFFGRITQGYVQQFQREQGLPSFGIAGSMTRAAIAKVCSSNASNNQTPATSGTSSSLSCSTFSDITYGMFDTDPGGRVSQLQTWLGIPSSTFGFGTYGPKTRAIWNTRCGGTQTIPSTTYTPPTPTTPQPATYAPTCTFTPSSTGRADNIGFAQGSAQTADICKQNCIASRNAKWGQQQGGVCEYKGTNGIGHAVMSIPAEQAPIQTSSEPKCSYTSDSNDRPDNVGFNNQSQNLSGCVASCTMVRDAKWGLSDHGWCHFTGTNGATQMQFVPAAPQSDVSFTVSSSPTNITIATGQSATDGPNGIRITLQNVNSGETASLMVKVSSASQAGYYIASVGQTLGFADPSSPTGTVDVTVSSLQGQSATITIVAHAYPET